MLACVILVSLGLTVPLLFGVTTMYAQTAPPSFPVWKAYIASLPTPQAGCFVATYPNEVWQQTQCVTPPSEPGTVGNGNDWLAQTSGPKIGQTDGSFIASGITSEKVGTQANSYSIQLNSNINFPVTYHGKKVPGGGWEQFYFLNRVAPSPSTGLLFIQYWLYGYHQAYGVCPPYTQNPPRGTGWMLDSSGNNCYANSATKATPFMKATQLGSQELYGYANFKGKDEARLCFIPTKTCYAVSVKDSVLNLYKYWTQSEFNAVGNCCLSQAVFNTGTDIDVVVSIYDQTETLIAPTCVLGGFTGETNNLNLGSCGVLAGASILFNENNVS